MRKVIILPTAVSLLSLAVSQANAHSSNTQFIGNKMVINATRIEQPLEEVSRSIIVIEKDEIDSIQPQSVAEILAYEPNVLIEGGSRPGYQTINIRGLGDNRILQTIDGVPQDFESGHRASYFLDPVLLKSLEVVKGPASTLWGSGALGGVVSQTTIDADDILDVNQDIGGLIKTGWNFNNDQSTTTTVLAGQQEQFNWLTSIYYRDSDDIETGSSNLLPNSASLDKGFLGKFNYALSEDEEVKVQVRHADVAGGVPTNASTNVNNTSVFLINKDQVNTSASIGYALNSNSPFVNAEITAYWNGVEIDETRVSDNRFDKTDKDTYGLNASNISKIGDVTLIVGADGYSSNYETRRGGSDRPAEQDTDVKVWGAFTQVNIPIQSNLEFEFGLRYDHFSTEAKHLDNKRSNSELSPSAAIIWNAARDLEFTLRHDQAFRAPAAEELYSTGTHFCMFPGFCNTFLSNPNLKPEKASNTELIAKFKINDEFKLTGSVFHNKVDDFIEQTVTPPVFFPIMDAGNTIWSNVDKAKLKGYEITTEYSKGNFNLKLGYGQTRGKDKNTGNPLSNIPADTWTVAANYTALNNQLNTGIRIVHAEEQHRSINTTYEDYTVADIYASWEPASIEALKLDLTINNLTDEHYRRAWSEIDEAGREVAVSASYKF